MANANEQDIRVYARILQADLLAAKPGSYSDNVTATITY
jgi:spore coat protein U-like protein